MDLGHGRLWHLLSKTAASWIGVPSAAAAAAVAAPAAAQARVLASVLVLHRRAASISSSDAGGRGTGVGNVSDEFKVAALVQEFRQWGHAAAQLDPLQRTRHGPWLGPWLKQPAPEAPPAGSLAALLDAVDAAGSRQEQAEAIAQHLGLSDGPLPAAQRTFPASLLDIGVCGGSSSNANAPPPLSPSPSPPAAASSSTPPSSLSPSSSPAAALPPAPPPLGLVELVQHMRGMYCGSLALEYGHIEDVGRREWLRRRFEGRQPATREQQRSILRCLVHAAGLEEFMGRRFPASKRFGIEGCEAVLPGLHSMCDAAAEHGVRRIELAMAHRGRLNVLVNAMRKPPGVVFSEMEGHQSEFHVGDVKYHLGKASTLRKKLRCGRSCKLDFSMQANPSHLEAALPVMMGVVRGLQHRLASRDPVMGVAVHGDAAFSGLGTVAEALQMSRTEGFSPGGVLHLVINNQVGFTTLPIDGRSSRHATSAARVLDAPVWHANADDPEAVAAACEMAVEWRAAFQEDCVVDIVGYRRHGHNEQDDPALTLPLTHAAIAGHPPVLASYSRRCVESGAATHKEVDAWKAGYEAKLAAALAMSETGQFRESVQEWMTRCWTGDALTELLHPNAGPPALTPAARCALIGGTAGGGGDMLSQQGGGGTGRDLGLMQEATGLPLATLQWVGREIGRLPEGFEPHPTVAQILEGRRSSVESADGRVNFAMAEALALGTLMLHRGVTPPGMASDELPPDYFDPALGLNRGHYAVRLTGQDVQRGTFNQRHAVVSDQRTGERYTPLNNIAPGRQQQLCIFNSPLSEAGVMAFEYGYGLAAGRSALSIWEAQFGDFANNAQVVIDTFIASGEERWDQPSGLVLMLPHGFDGQGPDHSSARVERFLSLLNDDPDFLPGASPAHRKQISSTFEAVAQEHGGSLTLQQCAELLRDVERRQQQQQQQEQTLPLQPCDNVASDAHPEVLDRVLAELWASMGLAQDDRLTEEGWQDLMASYIRRNYERAANLFVCNVTTPAQLFHVLRRQVNRPFLRPLVLFSPKYLLHHKPATSALSDLATGQHFSRVIVDSVASDNTRHLASHPTTGEAYLMPPHGIRRVVMCSGQIYYLLSRARRARRTRDIVLLRLEQLAPFPHDHLIRVLSRYPNAQLVWCQEEPKNMGAYAYVRPRLEAALQDMAVSQGALSSAPGNGSNSTGDSAPEPCPAAAPRRILYVGRPPSASPATASMAIHLAETRELVDAAMQDGSL